MQTVTSTADSAAIQALIPELRVAARELVGGAVEEADALVQEVLLVALKNWGRLPSGAGLKPWLLSALRDPALVERTKQRSAVSTERD